MATLDIDSTPVVLLLNALAARVGEIEELRVRTKRGTAEARSMARVYPERFRFRDTIQMDARRMVEAGVNQVQTLPYEIAIRVTDLVQSQRLFYFEEEIIRLVSDFCPYLGLNGTSAIGLSPFYPVGAARELVVRSKDSPIVERIITVECQMERIRGIPPKLVPNTQYPWDKSKAVDIYGYLPYQVVA